MVAAGLIARVVNGLPAEDNELERGVHADLVRELYRRSHVTIAFFLAFVLLLHRVLGSAYRHGTGVAWTLDIALVLILVRFATVLAIARHASTRLRYWTFTSLTASIGI